MADNALTFVPKIIEAHNKVRGAGRSALDHAIKCGEYLTQAQKKVNTAGGNFTGWPKEHCEIPQSTASLYMRLYKNRRILEDEEFSNALEKTATEDLSIRAFDKLITDLSLSPEKREERERKADEKKIEAAKDKQILKDIKSGKTPVVRSEATDLAAIAPDEIVIAWKNDEDKIQELAGKLPLTTVLEQYPPREICEALCTVIPLDKLFKLSSMIIQRVLSEAQPDKWDFYKKELADMLEAAKTPDQEPLAEAA